VSEIRTTTHATGHDIHLGDETHEVGPIVIAYLDGVVWVSVE